MLIETGVKIGELSEAMMLKKSGGSEGRVKGRWDEIKVILKKSEVK